MAKSKAAPKVATAPQDAPTPVAAPANGHAPPELRDLLAAAAVVPLGDLFEDPGNVRRHGERNLAAIKASLQRFGQVLPLVVVKGRVVAGNGRLRAMRDLGWTHGLVVVRDRWDETTAAAYAIADNRTAELAEWDNELLAAALAALPQSLRLDSGFDAHEIANLMRGLRPPTDELAPARPANPKTCRGDVYVLGSHRITCGDSTHADDVARALDGAQPFLMVTDPPYGVEYNPAWRSDAAAAGHRSYAERRVGQVANDDRSDWAEAWRLFKGDVAYSWSPPGSMSFDHHAALVAAGFEVRMQLVWSKPHFPISRGHYHVRHEPCWYAVRRGASARWAGGRKQTTVWDITLDSNVGGGGHSTQKPVECMERPMRNHGAAGDVVYDPFLGSGTSVIAAERSGRVLRGLEIDPGYCDVTVARWEQATGKKAELIRS